jgi:cell division protein FtsQ
VRINKNKIKKIFISIVWLLAGAGCITLLVSGVRSKNAQRCKGVDIEISGVSNNFFIDKNDVYAIIKDFGGDSTGKRSLASVDLRRIEKELEKDVWVKHAVLYFDNNDILKVWVAEREPVARIFTTGGNTFYTDSSTMRLPLSEKFSARLPVFTGFPSDALTLSAADSVLLSDIKNISLKICADSFLMAMIDQVDITANRSFEMTPKIGRQNIIFGDATDADVKFAKLKLFYKEVIPNTGWNRYQTINLQYKGQVVATVKGKADVLADSLQTLARLKAIALDAAGKSADSTQDILPETNKNMPDSSIIQQSVQHNEESEPEVNSVNIPATVQAAQPKFSVPKPAHADQKPAQKLKPASPAQKPKPKKPATAKPNNDY